MLPFSYQGFGFTFILLMVLLVSAGYAVGQLREMYSNRKHHRDQ
jgi:hypothetical protein